MGLCLQRNRHARFVRATPAPGVGEGSKVERVEVTARGVVSTGSITGL
jgi:hypothetical protein